MDMNLGLIILLCVVFLFIVYLIVMWIIFPVIIHYDLVKILNELKNMHRHTLKTSQYSCDRLHDIEDGLTDICDNLTNL